MTCEPSAITYIVLATIIIEATVLVAAWIVWPRRKRFEPDLIHLLDYERWLLYQREHGLPPIPVQPIPNVGRWSKAEVAAMEYNRIAAREVLDRIFPGSDSADD